MAASVVLNLADGFECLCIRKAFISDQSEYRSGPNTSSTTDHTVVLPSCSILGCLPYTRAVRSAESRAAQAQRHPVHSINTTTWPLLRKYMCTFLDFKEMPNTESGVILGLFSQL